MNKATENFIAAELAAYYDNLRELELLREEILEGSPGPADGMPRGNTTSNPTADKAMRLISRLRIITTRYYMSFLPNTHKGT